MKVGVYFTPHKDQGGVYQYSIEFLRALSEISDLECIVIATSTDIPQEIKTSNKFKIINVANDGRDRSIKIRDVLSTLFAPIISPLSRPLFLLGFFKILIPLQRMLLKLQIEVMEGNNLDLVFYPTTSHISFLANTPSVVAVHDLQHRINPQFREVSSGGRWEYREFGLRRITHHSFRIFVDSKVGKEQLLNYYPDSKGKVVILPYLPPDYLDKSPTRNRQKQVAKELNLPDRFVFYPSKFWPHKNHTNLVKALYHLKKDDKKVNLVLSGSKRADFSSYKKVMRLVEKLRLTDQIYYVGFVSPEQLSVLYKKARALVMPTYFGPSNIPVLEAWAMGTPVVYSDIPGCREQLDDAGLLVDPNDPQDIAAKVIEVYTNSDLRRRLTKKGERKIKEWNQEDFAKKIEKVIRDFEAKNE